ncbi:uncharacterized protein LOC143919146 [Arctopsyche grandis]|uniref:uncharacterized protein LOC143919146 n=1 Tax=Arctopsyche grandis TaxID=121162 RepID=UPI00406D6FA4
MTPRRTQQPAQQHHPSHRKPSLPTQLAQNKQPGREQDLDRHATQDPLLRQLSPAQPDKQRRHRVNRLQHIKIPTKSHTSLTLTGEPCRNLVVVIVIETFENIPQQQNTSSGTRQAFQKILRLDESKFPLYASTTKCSYDHFHQAFQKILRLDESKFPSYASTTKCSYASITTSIKRSRKFYASTKVHSFLTHQQTTTIGQAIPETL